MVESSAILQEFITAVEQLMNSIVFGMLLLVQQLV